MENEQTLTGLELRKAVLEAAGWTFGDNYSPITNLQWGAYTPNGKIYHAGRTLTYALEGCPPVESSVDAALQWLTLGDGLYWQLDGPVTGSSKDSSLAYIVDINTSMERVEVSNPAAPDEILKAIKFNKPLAEADGETLPVAMCRAFLAWKAGA